MLKRPAYASPLANSPTALTVHQRARTILALLCPITDQTALWTRSANDCNLDGISKPRTPALGRDGNLTTPRWRGNPPLESCNLAVRCVAVSANRRSRPNAAGGERQLLALQFREQDLAIELFEHLHLVQKCGEARIAPQIIKQRVRLYRTHSRLAVIIGTNKPPESGLL